MTSRIFQRVFRHASSFSPRTATSFARRRNFSNQAEEPLTWMDYAGLATFLGISVLAANLGVWQLRRREEKQKLIGERKAVLDAPPITITEYLARAQPESEDKIFQTVKVKGVFDYSKQILLGPQRPPPIPGVSQAATTTSPSYTPNIPGFFVITPFTTVEGYNLLVNRGWVTQKEGHNLNPESSLDSPQIVELTGLIRGTDKNAAVTDDIETLTRTGDLVHFVWLDLKEMSRYCFGSEFPVPYLEVFEPRLPRYPLRRSAVEYVDFPVMPHMHAVYAGTWFTMAIIFSYITFRRFRYIVTPLGAPKKKKTAAAIAFMTAAAATTATTTTEEERRKIFHR